MGRKRVPLPSRGEIIAFLTYDLDTGLFTWNSTGKPAGSLHKRTGYVSIFLNGHSYLAHRLAWAIVHTSVPDELDHINGDKADNRYWNLRPAARQQNNQNRPVLKSNKLAIKGVRKLPNGRFRARITIHGRRHLIGDFLTADAARLAYCKTAQAAFGEYARTA